MTSALQQDSEILLYFIFMQLLFATGGESSEMSVLLAGEREGTNTVWQRGTPHLAPHSESWDSLKGKILKVGYWPQTDDGFVPLNRA